MENNTGNCPVRDKINEYCSCPKTECDNHGLCCKCIVNHKNRVDEHFEKKFPHCLRSLLQEAIAENK